ncbi:MAG: RnfABCDGE type electron transport complex subunit G [Oscillospiraceae bacterium]|jgi:electron transport complex protein RnfG|nr:RnfABCDGE type electron transport complex subunit G [Oscillospiraceae bacterium]
MSKEKASVSPKPSSPAFSVDPRYVGRITGILLAICLIVSLLLGVVNQITKPRIDAIQAEKIRAAMAQVLEADEYLPIQLQKDLKGVQSVSEARTNGGTLGYVVQVTASGSQGEIQMMVGVDVDNRVTGVSVIKHSETPNIGTKVVADQSVLDRFIGMDHANGEITVNSGSNRFDGISGATVSSKGVAAGVNTALAAAYEAASGLVK